MLILHDYWRSSAAYRVRIGLNLKGLAYEQRPVNLLASEQKQAPYTGLNPQGLVPALEADGVILTQSLAILGWLEEQHPHPALMPGGARDRALVRSMAALIACDIHPLNNLRVLKALKGEFGADQARIDAWAQRWIGEGFDPLETMIERHGGGFCFGGEPTLADCCLAPQVYSARRFNVDLAPWPRLSAAAAAAEALEPFVRAHPDRQPDAPAA